MKTIFILITILAIGCSPQPKTAEQIKQDSLVAVQEKQQAEVKAAEEAAIAEVKSKLQAKAMRDWPDDFMTQEYWINEQIACYKYMLTVPESRIKEKAQRDFPLDFMTQKYWYNSQVDALERLNKK